MQAISDRDFFNDAWLGLTRQELQSIKYNPLAHRSQEDILNPGIAELRLMRDPEYLFWAAEKLLGVKLLPLQAAVLQELWIRPFPMFIASRGFGKSFLLSVFAMLKCTLIPGTKIVVVGSAFRQSKVLFEYMDTIWRNAPILRSICDNNSGPSKEPDRCIMKINDSWIVCVPLGDGCLAGDTMITHDDGFGVIEDKCDYIWGNGKFRYTDEHYDNGIKPTKIVKTKRGFIFEGTYNHKMKVLRGMDIQWVRSDEMKIGDYILIDREYRWHNGNFKCTPNEAYALGLMIGDGCWTNKYRLRFTTTDYELADSLKVIDNNWKKNNDDVHYNLDSLEKRKEWMDFWGLKTSYAKNKVLPKSILSSSRENMTACIQGLMDTDGSLQINKSKGGTAVTVSFSNTSEILVKQLQYILLHYGIVSTVSYRDRDENWNTAWELIISGQDVIKFHKNIGFRLRRKQDKLEQGVNDKIRTTSIEDIVPNIKDLMINIAKDYSFSRKLNKDNGISLSVLKSRKEITFEYLNRFITKYSPTNDNRLDILKKLYNENIFFDVITEIKNSTAHTYDMHVPEEHEYCANGFFSHNTKIRGLRAHTILADEFACLEKNTLVETNEGLVRIGEDDCKNKKLYTGDNNLLWETPSRYIVTPPSDVYEIKLENGYVIRCSENHKIMTNDGWKKPLELSSIDYIESHNSYKFPDKSSISSDIAWLLGILTSEGSVTDKYLINIKTTNPKLKDFIVNKYNFKVCEKSYDIYKSDKKLRNELYKYGLDYVTAHDKKIPNEILKQPRHIVIEFLKGMFEGDGSCFLFSDKTCENRLGLAYYSVSETLCRDLQVVIDKLGYDSYINNRDSEISDNKQWFVRLNDRDAYNLAKELDIDKFKEPIKNCYIPEDPSYITWDKNRNKWKVQFRRLGKTIQKRFVKYEDAKLYVEELKTLPRYRKVVSVKKLDDKQVLYDYHLPVTHSFYAGGSRQHNSIPPNIYETVVSGFAAVSASPLQNVQIIAKRKEMEKAGVWSQELEEDLGNIRTNQSILSGTAYYAFNHFASYWKRYKKIIESKGDINVLREIYPDEPVEKLEKFNWYDYSIMRIPYELIPEGFMDDKTVSRAKATVDKGIYDMEYGAVFSEDSNGFFKRSLIESCVTSDTKPIILNGREIVFDALINGDLSRQYVFSVDPASEVDKLAITILELHEDHTRVVYCWTINKQQHRERIKRKLANEHDFYGFCARKIRDLMKTFPCAALAIDAQGGGYALLEALNDPDKMREGELPLLPIIEDDKEKETDNMSGLHIVHIIQFAKYEWTRDANHGLKKDLTDKLLLFPRFDPVSLALAAEQDRVAMEAYEGENPDKKFSLYDSLEDCVMEIEELKNELATITVTITGTGVNSRERWDTPEIKEKDGKKGRLRKDRYSALVMSNMVARSIHRAIAPPVYEVIGGQIGRIKAPSDGQLYKGPDWYTQTFTEDICTVIRRK